MASGIIPSCRLLNTKRLYLDEPQPADHRDLHKRVLRLQAPGKEPNAVVCRDHVSVHATGRTPNFSDFESGRRQGSFVALDDYCKPAQNSDVIHLIGPFAEARDNSPAFRHLARTRSVASLTDGNPFVFFPGAEAAGISNIRLFVPGLAAPQLVRHGAHPAHAHALRAGVQSVATAPGLPTAQSGSR